MEEGGEGCTTERLCKEESARITILAENSSANFATSSFAGAILRNLSETMLFLLRWPLAWRGDAVSCIMCLTELL